MTRTIPVFNPATRLIRIGGRSDYLIFDFAIGGLKAILLRSKPYLVREFGHMNSPESAETSAESSALRDVRGAAPIVDATTVSSDTTNSPTQPDGQSGRSSSLPAEEDLLPIWLRRTDQIFLGVLLIALLGLLIAYRWKLSNGFRTEIEITSQRPREFYYALDINQASWVEWAQLDGIGEKLAKRIVLDRQERGPFQSVDEVQRVKGVGPKMMEKLRPFLKFQPVSSSASSELTQPAE